MFGHRFTYSSGKYTFSGTKKTRLFTSCPTFLNWKLHDALEFLPSKSLKYYTVYYMKICVAVRLDQTMEEKFVWITYGTHTLQSWQCDPVFTSHPVATYFKRMNCACQACTAPEPPFLKDWKKRMTSRFVYYDHTVLTELKKKHLFLFAEKCHHKSFFSLWVWYTFFCANC